MNKRQLAKAGLVAGSLMTVAPYVMPLIPPPYQWLAGSVMALAGFLFGLPMANPMAKKPLQDSKKSTLFIPPLPLLLLLVLGGCGGVANASVTDARNVTTAVLDCVEAAGSAENVRAGLLGCAPPTLRVISTMCASGIIPRGEFCNEVSGLVN